MMVASWLVYIGMLGLIVAGKLLWDSTKKSSFNDKRAERELGAYLTILSIIFLLIGFIASAQPKQNAVKTIAGHYVIDASHVSILNPLPIACNENGCYSWEAEVYINRERVGIVRYSEESVQYFPFDEGYVPEIPTPVVVEEFIDIDIEPAEVFFKVEALSEVNYHTLDIAIEEFSEKNDGVFIEHDRRFLLWQHLSNKYNYKQNPQRFLITPVFDFTWGEYNCNHEFEIIENNDLNLVYIYIYPNDC